MYERKTRYVRCPTCGKKTRWDGNPWRPFCSERCKLVDFGKWLDGEYRIERGEEEDEERN